jgi:hypothetical protein
MNARGKITADRIEALRAKLVEADAAPVIPPDTSTKMGAVAALASELLTLRRKGWGLEALAAMLREGGLDLTPATLKNYLQRAGATRTKRHSKQLSRVQAPPATNRPAAITTRASAAFRAAAVALKPTSPQPPREPGTFVVREDTKDL